jgi:hypothetical protein
VIGGVIQFKQFSLWKAALCGAGVCYFIIGALFTVLTVLSGPTIWSQWGAHLSFLFVALVLAGVGGAVVGSLSWVAGQLSGAFKRRGIAA